MKSLNPSDRKIRAMMIEERKQEQLYYPALKFQKIREDYLEHYWQEGYTPTDACNDILTAT